MTGALSLRPAVHEDEPFLHALYLDAHPEFTLLPAAAADEVVTLQRRAQRAEYRAAYPTSVDHVVEYDGARVGHCWTSVGDAELRVLDLALLTAHRRRGIGRAILEQLLARAAASGTALRLSVWRDNVPARTLYARAGLAVEAEQNGYLLMAARPGEAA